MRISSVQYKLRKELGKGYFAILTTGKIYAAKIVNKKILSRKTRLMVNEIAVLKKISQLNPHLLSLTDYYETSDSFYLITEIARGGELFERIYDRGNYYEKDAAEIVRQILKGVVCLHEHGVVHRDLKPENILFETEEEDSNLVIADFGLAKLLDDTNTQVLTTACGTMGYIAPEVLKQTGYGKPVDMWAIGVITFFLLCGYCPFDRDSPTEEIKAVMNCDYSFSPTFYWTNISGEAKEFISNLLVLAPDKRWTAQQALKSDWLDKFCAMSLSESESNSLPDLLPAIRQNPQARQRFRKVVNAIRVVSHLRNQSTSSGRSPKSPATPTPNEHTPLLNP
ncbi:kinase-like protein [Basidiobolus meristosporus CBS 931.73]|uniref:Kinase-like protein n=1 Tax=Basidiobolus meristosporus CBS 931.73 TaxID=1314790 RepID=A0A1Y1X231_9FUNG|nr:kinase-like protein [Basidiobolus meristosporus CBS 931.73]|eukprot:ORX79871.1 kinase-like protein [Basidiobolus meristosporus CBS 931.73]